MLGSAQHLKRALKWLLGEYLIKSSAPQPTRRFNSSEAPSLHLSLPPYRLPPGAEFMEQSMPFRLLGVEANLQRRVPIAMTDRGQRTRFSVSSVEREVEGRQGNRRVGGEA